MRRLGFFLYESSPHQKSRPRTSAIHGLRDGSREIRSKGHREAAFTKPRPETCRPKSVIVSSVHRPQDGQTLGVLDQPAKNAPSPGCLVGLGQIVRVPAWTLPGSLSKGPAAPIATLLFEAGCTASMSVALPGGRFLHSRASDSPGGFAADQVRKLAICTMPNQHPAAVRLVPPPQPSREVSPCTFIGCNTSCVFSRSSMVDSRPASSRRWICFACV